MDLRKIKKLIDLIENTNVTEIEITEGEESLKIIQSDGNLNAPTVAKEQPATAKYVEKTDATIDSKQYTGHQITSPMVGTLHRSSSPKAKMLVEEGQYVNVGDKLCIIEAMKMFNEIEADKAGTVTHCLVEDGQAVEYQQLLFVIK